MSVTRLLLIRHGESLAQERRIVGGHAGCAGLSARGRRQVAALHDRLARTGELAEATALCSSVMPRAVETAHILAPALGGPDVVQDCDLCEHHPGEADGLTWEEYDRRFPAAPRFDPTVRRAPGAETWQEMAERVNRGLDALLERHAGETAVVATHGGVVVASILRWLKIDVGDLAGRAWIDPVNTSITEWRFGPTTRSSDPSTIELVRYNDHAHLAGLD